MNYIYLLTDPKTPTLVQESGTQSPMQKLQAEL